MAARRAVAGVKTIRYGTIISPSIAKGIVGSFPGHSSDGFNGEKDSQIPQVSFHEVERVSSSVEVAGRYPSISAILGCTQSQKNLYWWQMKTIKQLGGEGSFRKYMRGRIESGMAYHARINRILSDFCNDGHIAKTDDELLENVREDVAGYLRSVLPVLRSLDHSKQMLMEQYANHHLLCYYGRFDAIVCYRDALFLVDWKTASAGSSKENSTELAQMYGDPLQVAAYVGAVNCDPKFSHLSKITHGAVVVAKEDGSSAHVAEMRPADIEEYWQKWLECIHRFWHELATRPVSRGVVSFVSKGE